MANKEIVSFIINGRLESIKLSSGPPSNHQIRQHMGGNLSKGREIYNLGLQRPLLTVWFF